MQSQDPALTAPPDILIDDLAHPRMTPKILAARRGPADFPDRLSVDEILARASDMAGGLADFGPDDFKTRLAVYVRSWEEDADLSRGGRITLLQQAIRVMANRLKIEDLVKRRPEILEIEIERPIIIAGLPRSGTTHMVNWLARDQRLRSLTLWESEEPVPIAEPEPGTPDPRMLRSAKYWGEFESMLPHMPAMHGMEASSIHEDNELLFMDVNSYNWEWQARSPNWIDHYFAHDRTGSYLYEKKVLQVLTWFRGPNRWILKSPQHMENLAAMKAAFPDATMVITHRDPVAVLASLLTMVGYADRIRRDRIDPPGLARHWIDRIERLLRACLEQRASWDADQSLDVLFHEYMADQEAVMRRVYRMAELPLTAGAEQALLAYLAENPRHQHGKVAYDLKGDFGVDPEALRERFAFYYEAYPVRQERTR
jgi:hypothetical protein